MASEFSGVPASRDAQHCIEDGRRRFVMIYVDHLDLWSDKKNGLKPSALAVYLCLLRHASWHTRKCFPSLDVIGNQTSQSRSTVVAAVKSLVKAGLVSIRKEKVPGGYERSVYTILDPAPSGQFENQTEPTKIYDAEFDSTQNPGSKFEPKQEPIEQDPEGERAKNSADDLPEHGPAQKIVKAFCMSVGISEPVDYGKAVGQAQKLVRVGIGPEDIPGAVAWCRSEKWVGAFDLGTIVLHADKWRGVKAAPKPIRRLVV